MTEVRIVQPDIKIVRVVVPGPQGPGTDVAKATVRPRDASAARPLEDILGDRINPLHFEDSGAAAKINAAILKASERGGQGSVVEIPNLGSEWELEDAIIMRSRVQLIGVGKPVLKKANGLNKAVIESYDFANQDLASGEGINSIAIENLVVDGNIGAQTVASDYINGISLYGSSMRLKDIMIRRVKGHGLRTNYAGSAENITSHNHSEMSQFHNIMVDHCGRHGWYLMGPHDIHATFVTVADAGQEADDTYCGLYQLGPNAQGQFYKFHGWSRGSSANRMKYVARVNGGSQFALSEFEGGRCQMHVVGNNARFSLCRWYAHFGADRTPLMLVEASAMQIDGGLFTLSNRPIFAIQFGSEQVTAAQNRVVAQFEQVGAELPLYFRNESSNDIYGYGFRPTTAGANVEWYESRNPQPSTRVFYDQNDFNLTQSGQFLASAKFKLSGTPTAFGASQTLSASLVGGAVYFNGSSAATFTLPLAASAAKDTPLLVSNIGTADLTVAFQGSDAHDEGAGSILVPPGERLWLYSNGGTIWHTLSRSNMTSPRFSGIVRHSLDTGRTATGTTQADAFSVTKAITSYSTVASGSGARLPVIPGGECIIMNFGANALNVYPPPGAKIDAAANDVPVTVAPNGKIRLICTSPTQWRTI